jgi:lipid-A-disaccharide synthase
LESILAAHPDLAQQIEFLSNKTENLPGSAVLMSSGTMSLGCALSGIPGAIAYRLNPMSYWLGRLLVKVKYIGIANLLLDRPLHPEFIQSAASPTQLSRQLLRALDQSEVAAEAQDAAVELRELLKVGNDSSAAEWLAKGLERVEEV